MLRAIRGNWEFTLLTASCPSTIPVSGLENQSLNWAWLANTCVPKASAMGNYGIFKLCVNRILMRLPSLILQVCTCCFLMPI